MCTHHDQVVFVIRSCFQDLLRRVSAQNLDGSSPLGSRAAVISSYALCGFANFASIAIQIGGIGAMAPERRADLARLGLRAMFGGMLASNMTACVAGMLI